MDLFLGPYALFLQDGDSLVAFPHRSALFMHRRDAELNVQTVVGAEARDYSRMPHVKSALILLPSCSPLPPF